MFRNTTTLSFFIIIIFLPLSSCSKDIDLEPQNPVTIRFLYEPNEIVPLVKSGLLGPRKAEVSISLVFVSENQIHHFFDEETRIMGRIEIYQPECGEKSIVTLPDEYIVTERPPQVGTINPCVKQGKTTFHLNLNQISIVQSKDLKNRNYRNLNVYPEITEDILPKLEVIVRLRPKPGPLF